MAGKPTCESGTNGKPGRPADPVRGLGATATIRCSAENGGAMSDRIEVREAAGSGLQVETLAVAAFEDEGPATAMLGGELRVAVERLAEGEGWRGGSEQVRHGAGIGGIGGISLWGLGAAGDLDRRGLAAWLERVVAAARAAGVAHLAIALPDHPVARGEEGAELVSRSLHQAAYRFDRFKGKKGPEPRLAWVEVLSRGEGGSRARARLGRGASRRVHPGSGQHTAQPGDAGVDGRAGRGARRAPRLRRPRAGARRAGRARDGRSARGRRRLVPSSANGASGVGEGDRTVALVGKGVTFDTGGISLKPPAAMDEMKYDKCGACTVLGVAEALAELGVPGRFRAYLPLAENMPDGSAYRPGDIVRCYDGQTVEVLNTDAEGRMILADALAWAAEDEPDVLIEYSTLTGACVVALGLTGAGLYTPDDALAEALLAAAGRTGERLWRMPLWREFRESLKGTHGDLRNVAGRWGGANTAAAFLSAFVGGVRRWAHLDIAGPAAVGADGDGTKGATGYGVALTVDWLRRAGATG